MAMAMDCVYNKCLLIKARPALILQKKFYDEHIQEAVQKAAQIKRTP